MTIGWKWNYRLGWPLAFVCLALASWPLALLATTEEPPIWANKAIGLAPDCNGAPANAQIIPSPDRKVRVEVRCRMPKPDEDQILYLHIVLPNGSSQDVQMERGAHELLWSPDSTAFFVNGGESAYAGFFVRVYRIEGDKVRNLDVTSAAQRDMVASFPPCKAYNRSEQSCRNIEKNPEYNMSGLAWSDGGSAIVVIGEVPCSSSYGGIMCQILGYRVDVGTGAILQRMTARELKERWQNAMTWQLRIPPPPTYGPPLSEPPKR